MKKFWFATAFALVAVWALGAGNPGLSQTAPQDKAGKNTATEDKAAIEALEQRYSKAFNSRNVEAIMANYAPASQVFVFDAVPPREYANWEAYKKDWEGLFAEYPGPLKNEIAELNITVVGTVAYAHHVETGYFTRKNGSKLEITVRVTDVFRKFNGKWLIVLEHVSFPVDLETGKADLLSKK